MIEANLYEMQEFYDWSKGFRIANCVRDLVYYPGYPGCIMHIGYPGYPGGMMHIGYPDCMTQGYRSYIIDPTTV